MSLAAAQGEEGSSKKNGDITAYKQTPTQLSQARENRDIIASRLTPAQLSQAQALAVELKGKIGGKNSDKINFDSWENRWEKLMDIQNEVFNDIFGQKPTSSMPEKHDSRIATSASPFYLGGFDNIVMSFGVYIWKDDNGVPHITNKNPWYLNF